MVFRSGGGDEPHPQPGRPADRLDVEGRDRTVRRQEGAVQVGHDQAGPSHSLEFGEGEPPPEGDGDPGDGDADAGDGEAGEGDAEFGDGEGDADPGDGEDEGGGDPLALLDAVGGTGGGGCSCGACWKIRIAIRTARAASSIISSQDTRIVSGPPRSCRPGQGSGHSRAIPGRTRSIQCNRYPGPVGRPNSATRDRSTSARTRSASVRAAEVPS